MFRKFILVNPIGTDVLALMRISAGLLIHIHGNMILDPEKMQHMAGFLDSGLGLPFPLFMAYLSKGTEFFGGLLFALGFFTRFISLPLIINMAVAAFGSHHGQITGAGEQAFIYLLIFAVYFFVGSGKWSVDYLLRKKVSKKT
jgi:putative oxidoreductase